MIIVHIIQYAAIGVLILCAVMAAFAIVFAPFILAGMFIEERFPRLSEIGKVAGKVVAIIFWVSMLALMGFVASNPDRFQQTTEECK